MEYRTQDTQHHRVQPRLIIHGGAGNIQRHNYPPEKYQAYRDALITIVRWPLSPIWILNDYLLTQWVCR